MIGNKVREIGDLFNKGLVVVLDPLDTNVIDMSDRRQNVTYSVTFDEDRANSLFKQYPLVSHFDIKNIDKLFREKSVDTIVIDGSLHELFSREKNARENTNVSYNRLAGGKAVQQLFDNCYKILKDGGVLIIEGACKLDDHLYDEVYITPDKNFLIFLDYYLSFPNNIDKIETNEKGQLKMNLNTFVNVASAIDHITGDSQAGEKEYNFTTFDGLIGQIKKSGFSNITHDNFIDWTLQDLAQKVNFYNGTTNETKLPMVNYRIVAEK